MITDVNVKDLDQIQLIQAQNSKKELKEIRDDIQQYYLIQNKNGTFSINPIAYKIYPKNIVDEIEEGMNSINKEILSGNLKFTKKIVNGKVEIEGQAVNQVNRKARSARVAFNSVANIYGADLQLLFASEFLNKYASHITWKWWGYYCFVNSQGCGSLYSAWRGIIPASNILNGPPPQPSTSKPGPASAILGAAGLLYGINAQMVKTLWSGWDNGKGCTLSFSGNLTSGKLISVKPY